MKKLLIHILFLVLFFVGVVLLIVIPSFFNIRMPDWQAFLFSTFVTVSLLVFAKKWSSRLGIIVEEYRKSKKGKDNSEKLTHIHYVYAYCLARVAKADGVVTEAERENAMYFIYSKFPDQKLAGSIYKKFTEFLDGSYSSQKIDSCFNSGMTYQERYAFAEVLCSLPTDKNGSQLEGIFGNVAKELNDLMRQFALEEKDVAYLCNKYKITVSNRNDNKLHLTKVQITFVYCLVRVAKADGVVTDAERENAMNFIKAKFPNQNLADALCYRLDGLLKRPSLSKKISSDFIGGTTYPERYAFTEMLCSLATEKNGMPFYEITGNVAKELSALMRQFALEERDVAYLCNKYKIKVKESNDDKSNENEHKSDESSAKNDPKLMTFAHCFALVAKADGNVSNEERRMVGAYFNSNYTNATEGIGHLTV